MSAISLHIEWRQLLNIALQTYQANTWQCTCKSKLISDDLFRQNECWNGWDMWSISITCNNEPFTDMRNSILIFTCYDHMHAAIGRTHRIKPVAHFEEWASDMRKIEWQPGTNKP